MNELTSLLAQQQALLNELLVLIEAEKAALIAQQADELLTLAEKKSAALLALKKNDDTLAAHPAMQRLTSDPELAAMVDATKSTLAQCKRDNQLNAQLIEHNEASINRLAQALQMSRNANSLTYTGKGRTSTIASLGNSIEV
ncbi:flagella synthesis protein FlgN [Shewanella sp.]|uniref:flagella synthesis protein FlgN n=1 Tax=Shewanella sp. TaxID=50422 RepID=UPI003568E9E0